MRWLRRLARQSKSSDSSSTEDVPRQLNVALVEPDRDIYSLVAAASDPASSGLVAATMERWHPGVWFRLDAVRLGERNWQGEAPPSPRGGWRAVVASPASETLLIVLASTHRDGYLRERAVRRLASMHGSLAAAALAVRAVDHVPEVREAARAALEARVSSADADAIVPILLAGQKRAYAPGAAGYIDRLGEEALRSLAGSEGPATRLTAIAKAPLHLRELVSIARRDPDVRCRQAASERALEKDARAAVSLIESRAADVRALAIARAPEDVVKSTLERFLLDRSVRVRRAAQRRASVFGFDSAGLYRSCLPERNAILGLGETGAEEDAARLTPLLGDELATRRRAAVRALGVLAKTDTLARVLPPRLHDEAAGVVREAARQMRRRGLWLDESDLDRALASPHPTTRRVSLQLIAPRDAWAALLACLVLYDDPDSMTREAARSVFEWWLSARAATAYRAPTVVQRQSIDAQLKRADLPRQVKDLVRFHAGLPR